MRITCIETIPVRVPIKPALAIRGACGLSHSVSPFLLVKVHTDEGIIGVGEASCTPRWCGEDQVTAAHFIDQYFAPLLIGETIDDTQHLNAKFSAAVAGNFFTKSAVEMALWDILGKAQGKPVWEITGSSEHGARNLNSNSSPLAPRSSRLTIPTKWSVSGLEPSKAAEIAKWAVAQGFSKMKVKVGIEPRDDLTRVRAVREAVGPTIKLGVDANGGWTTPDIAIETVNQLCDQCQICFVEQPVRAGNPPTMAEVRRNVSVPIIADESIYTLDDAKILARAESADVFSIYVGKAGGLGPARAIVEFAQSAGIKCTIGSNLELGVGSAAMIHLALAAPGIDAEAYPCDIIGPLFYEDDVLTEPLPICGGSARVHDRPGLGVELDDEKVEKYRVR